MFRQNWNYDPTLQSTEEALDHFLDVLETIKKLISEGKIRHFGLSNESAWGVATWIKLSEKYNLPRVVSIQNEYSLLCRLFDTDLAELSHHENVGLLAFSPLAAGLLSGKYQNGVIPEGSRMSIVPNLGGRVSENAFNAINCYIAVAKKFNIDPCQMALAFCRSRGFVSSAIIGATKKAQLKNALESTALKLNDEILQEIGNIHKRYPMPY
jgi:aryl-alcohol dehydrogenase-like predicted oxidoreductase